MRCDGLRATLVLAWLAALAGCGGGSTSPTPVPTPTPTPTPAAEVEFVGAGDIADCATRGAEATARLLDVTGGDVYTIGDNAYPNGSATDFANCYAPTWGRHLERTHPIPGNHDYVTPDAAAYFDYFDGAAGVPGLGYYSYTLGAWHVVALNSNIAAAAGSAQAAWLDADLASHPAPCTLAYFHHPMFSSGPSQGDRRMLDVWGILYKYRVDVVLNGHDHLYERFAPQDANGLLDVSRGIREFVVGTGGAPLYTFGRIHPNSEAHASVWGVLRLRLRAQAYDWDFLPVAGQSFHDSGTAACVP